MKKPRTHEEIVLFEELVEKYCTQFMQYEQVPSLTVIYSTLASHPEKGRVLACAEDLILTAAFLEEEWLQFYDSDTTPGPIHYTDTTVYATRNDLRRVKLVKTAVGFVLRYRAYWDKLMGFLVVLLVPKEYDRFVRADSKKKEFMKIMAATLAEERGQVLALFDLIQRFDDDFRTAEAHGPGRLRKLIYDYSVDREELKSELLDYKWIAELWLIAIRRAFGQDDPENHWPMRLRGDLDMLSAALSKALRAVLAPPLRAVP